MSIDPLLAQARGLWEELARVPVAFGAAGDVRVVVSPQSWMCPAGWVGVVLLGGSAIVAAPSEADAGEVGRALSGLGVDTVVDAGAVSAVLPVAEVLGPAALAYLGARDFQPVSTGSFVVDQVPASHPELRELEESASDDDVDEAGLEDITSPAFVIRVDGSVVAAAGYRTWPRETAHLSVLTAADLRGQGLGRAAASSAVAHALAVGLLPQWRARPLESRRVAAALGFRELGFQLSFRLA